MDLGLLAQTVGPQIQTELRNGEPHGIMGTNRAVSRRMPHANRRDVPFCFVLREWFDGMHIAQPARNVPELCSSAKQLWGFG